MVKTLTKIILSVNIDEFLGKSVKFWKNVTIFIQTNGTDRLYAGLNSQSCYVNTTRMPSNLEKVEFLFKLCFPHDQFSLPNN